MSARRLTVVGLVSLCALCGGFALAGASARAAVIHDYLSQITEVPASPGVTVPGPLQAMESMTFDSGHVWIAELFEKAYRVDEFDAATGAFVSQPVHAESPTVFGTAGIAVGHATGEAEIYVGESVGGEPAVAVFNEAGTPQGTWKGADTPGGSFGSEVDDVAVDNSKSLSDWSAGDVYVTVPSQRVIDVFRPEAGGKEKYVTQLTSTSPSEPFQVPTKMAVNEANGDLVVRDNRTVDVLEPTALGEYALVRKITGPPPSGSFNEPYNLAVDSGSGEIYVTEGFGPSVVDEFSSTGTYLGHITGVDSPGGNLRDIYSLAVDPTFHRVYVADNRRYAPQALQQPPVLDFFGPDVVIPDVTTGLASPKTTSAALTGTVNPDKAGAATCQSVWGTSPELGQTAPCSAPVAEGASPVPVQAPLSGLEPDTTYYYLLQATNANGTNPGKVWQIQQFTTLGSGLHAEAVSAVTAESVTFDASIDPNNAPTTYYFQYGTTTGYGADVPSPPGTAVGSGKGDAEVSQHVQGLQAGTVYHYRVVAVSEVAPGQVEEFDGSDQTFTTQRAGSALGLPDGREWELVTAG